jgi:hypothetical protein
MEATHENVWLLVAAVTVLAIIAFVSWIDRPAAQEARRPP